MLKHLHENASLENIHPARVVQVWINELNKVYTEKNVTREVINIVS